MKRVVFLFTLVFALAMAASAQGIEIGATMDNFSMPDLEGKTRTLADLKGKSGTVVVFLSAQCPVVKGINFIGINSNSTEDLNWVKSDAAAVGYKFPLLIDKGNVFADKLGATVTPEVYYLDSKNVLLYHGAIDNDRSGKAITDTYLKTAFDSYLSGKKIDKTKANAFGCTIKRAKAE